MRDRKGGERMNFKNISACSIRNPIPPLVMFFGLTVAGIVSFLMMGLQSDPDIDFLGTIVIIAQPGAAPIGQSQTFVQFVKEPPSPIAKPCQRCPR